MLTQKEAIICLEAITTVVLSDLMSEEKDEEKLLNYEMNEEAARGNFLALWTILPVEERNALINKLKKVE